MQLTEREDRQPHWYWRELQVEVLLAELPTEEPADPEIGAEWYDVVACCVCIWDGAEWVAVPLD